MTAACFWRLIVACGIAVAVIVAVASGKLLGLSLLSTMLVGASILMLLPFAIVAASFAAARALRRNDVRSLSGFGCSLRAWWVESLALARAAVTIAGPSLRRHRSAPAARARASPVLLVHGILCDGHVWESIRKRLEAGGFGPVRAIDLTPLFADIDSHAQTVAHTLSAMRRDAGGAPVAIVAHSMGGLVARAALRLVASDAVSRLITIASPHHGSAIARLFPQVPLRQMRPESPWLRALNRRQEGHLAIPVTSIYSLEDRLVAPRSAILQGARMCELRRLGHLSLLGSGQTLWRVLAALEA